MYTNQMLEGAHKHSMNNASEILKSDKVGCFYCGKIYDAESLAEQAEHALLHPVTNPSGLIESTVWCDCWIDALIGDASGCEITEEFLIAMNERWFGDSGYMS